MNLYLISQSQWTGYDTFDSAVVVAESEDAARDMHPRGGAHVSVRDLRRRLGKLTGPRSRLPIFRAASCAPLSTRGDR